MKRTFCNPFNILSAAYTSFSIKPVTEHLVFHIEVLAVTQQKRAVSRTNASFARSQPFLYKSFWLSRLSSLTAFFVGCVFRKPITRFAFLSVKPPTNFRATLPSRAGWQAAPNRLRAMQSLANFNAQLISGRAAIVFQKFVGSIGR